MDQLQFNFTALFTLFNIAVWILSFKRAKKQQAFGETPWLGVLGIFVWGDALIFAPFWVLVGISTLYLKDWYLFLLLMSLFWLVRSIGETIYWFNQQFSNISRNPPERLMGYKLVKNDAVWYLYQIFWQCVTVVSSVTSLYLAARWLQEIF